METRSIEELDRALSEMGMLTVTQMIHGQPLMRHAGVCDLDTFKQWLTMRHEESLRMKAGLIVDGKEKSELFEWVMAHHAAFSEVLVNFNSVNLLGSDVQAEQPERNHNRQLAELAVQKFNRTNAVGTKVTYLKSEIEGKQITAVVKPAYIQGDSSPMVVLEGIGIAQLDKVEPI
ncbi:MULTISPECIES: hypothetical protein [Aeromonas]|uniref:hypothetical protein n=1 Tax=Aeromonas TaxID=642 RepID=UPI002B05192C|nr:hypothetical protein [Aeromonas jandaei]